MYELIGLRRNLFAKRIWEFISRKISANLRILWLYVFWFYLYNLILSCMSNTTIFTQKVLTCTTMVQEVQQKNKKDASSH